MNQASRYARGGRANSQWRRVTARRAGLLAMLSCAGSVTVAEPLPCVAIEDNAARLRCYDRHFGRPDDATGADAAVTPAADAAPSDPLAGFGMNPSLQRTKDQQSNVNRPETLIAKVVKARVTPDSRFVIELENGQVWQQSELEEDVRIKTGDTVVIRKQRTGGYLLHREGSNRSSFVRRVQ